MQVSAASRSPRAVPASLLFAVRMSNSKPQLIEHLLSRRSIPAIRLIAPGPSAEELSILLTAAARVPDHGKLAPWRFIIIEGAARQRLVDCLMDIWRSANPGASAAATEVERGKRSGAPTVIAVVSQGAPHPKIPEWEQKLSAGAVCMNLLHAATALGYAGQWLTGWPAYDEAAMKLLGVEDGERVAGFVHVGSPAEAPVERDRPDIEALTTRWQG